MRIPCSTEPFEGDLAEVSHRENIGFSLFTHGVWGIIRQIY
jgi:hypothetical protein